MTEQHDTAADERDEEETLRGDERGAVMVMGVFMAVLLVGMIYYVMGIGETILYKERMQDAADAGAFAAAVIHARGMNLIALLNLVMAAVIAVLVAVKVIEYLLLAALTIATAICAACSCPGCCGCCAACPIAVVLEIGYEDVSSFRESLEPTVDAIVEALAVVQDGIAIGMPIAAQSKVIQYGEDTYDPPTEMGLMWPIFAELPVEDDDSDKLCKEASYQGGRLAAPLVGLWPIRAFVGTATAALSSLFCDYETAKRVNEDIEEMGAEEFQVRAFMIGDPPFDDNDTRVAVATWGREDEADSYELLEQLGHVSFAQAEFYYNGDVEPIEWLWDMQWKARLRRFRMPGDIAGLGALCSGGGCAGMGWLTDDIIVH